MVKKQAGKADLPSLTVMETLDWREALCLKGKDEGLTLQVMVLLSGKLLSETLLSET